MAGSWQAWLVVDQTCFVEGADFQWDADFTPGGGEMQQVSKITCGGERMGGGGGGGGG